MRRWASYRETYRQRRFLLSLPVIVALIVAAWFALGSPKSYRSTASLWVDNSPPGASSLGDTAPGAIAPSQEIESVVTELLSTRDFVFAVAHHSLLANYLATHTSNGWSPIALLSSLKGSGSLTSRIVGAFGPKQVAIAAPGPQVLQISYTGPTPAVAASTLNAITWELQRDSVRFSQLYARGAYSYYKDQVQAAAEAVSSARAQVNAYLSLHPGAGPSDSGLAALTAAQATASSELDQDTANLNAAASGLSGGTLAMQVIDPASMPAGPVSGGKKELLVVLGGIFAGGLITLLALIALTPEGSGDHEDIAPDAIPSNAIADDPIPSNAIAHDAIPSNAIADDPIPSNAIAPDAIASEAIAPDAVAPTPTAAGSVNGNEAPARKPRPRSTPRSPRKRAEPAGPQ